MTDDNVLGELQHELREQIRAAWASESWGEIRAKLERTADSTEGGTITILAGLIEALIGAVDRLAAEVDKINDRV
jgi:hypothetical protein